MRCDYPDKMIREEDAEEKAPSRHSRWSEQRGGSKRSYWCRKRPGRRTPIEPGWETGRELYPENEDE